MGNTAIDTSLDGNGQRRKVDFKKAFTLHLVNGVPEAEVARHFQVSRQCINQLLKPYKNLIRDQSQLKVVHENYNKVLGSVELTLLEKLVDAGKLKKASLNNIAYAFQNVANQRRLEEGKATSNVNIHTLSEGIQGDLADARDKLDELNNSGSAPQPVVPDECGEDTAEKTSTVSNT